MWDIFSVVLAGLVSFMNIVGVILPQWVTRRYQATDFGGRFRVGLLEYTSEVNMILYQLSTRISNSLNGSRIINVIFIFHLLV